MSVRSAPRNGMAMDYLATIRTVPGQPSKPRPAPSARKRRRFNQAKSMSESAGSELAQIRWAKATKAERLALGQRLAEARKAARLAREGSGSSRSQAKRRKARKS